MGEGFSFKLLTPIVKSGIAALGAGGVMFFFT